MMINKRNQIKLDLLLQRAKSQKVKLKPALWKTLFDRIDEIEEAKSAGLTYKKMAEAMNVSVRSFSVALKKARELRNKSFDDVGGDNHE